MASSGLTPTVPCPMYAGTPKLDTALQVGSQESREEGQDHPPCPADHAAFDTLQDIAGFLHCKLTLLVHKFLINQQPQVLLLRTSSNPFSTQLIFVLRISLIQVQDLMLYPVELHEVHMALPGKVPPDGILCLQCAHYITQSGVTDKLDEGAWNPIVHITDKDVKQD
ncbi:hypothetical protein TURU_095431 [Turdus rufiventris]|nr:hypothetical protein TURU_095431 [Turdus rufiventris]